MAGRLKTLRSRRPRVRSRFLALAAIALVGLLYYKPLRSYTATRAQLAHRQSEVQSLRSANRALEQRLADAGRPEELLRQARRLGLVRPGERLFIVNGIAAWRRSVAKRTGR